MTEDWVAADSDSLCFVASLGNLNVAVHLSCSSASLESPAAARSTPL